MINKWHSFLLNLISISFKDGRTCALYLGDNAQTVKKKKKNPTFSNIIYSDKTIKEIVLFFCNTFKCDKLKRGKFQPHLSLKMSLYRLFTFHSFNWWEALTVKKKNFPEEN